MQNQILCFLPAKARVGDRFTVHLVTSDFLTTILQIALNDEAFEKFVDVAVVTAWVKHLFAYTRLLKIFFTVVLP